MYKHILVPTDGSELSLEATRQAIAFARSMNASITFLNVQPDYPVPTLGEGFLIPAETRQEFSRRGEEQAQNILSNASDLAKQEGVPCSAVTLVSDFPYSVIIDTATSAGCDLIFMASHGRRGLSGVLIGSETLKVLTHCKIPVLVYR